MAYLTRNMCSTKKGKKKKKSMMREVGVTENARTLGAKDKKKRKSRGSGGESLQDTKVRVQAYAGGITLGKPRSDLEVAKHMVKSKEADLNRSLADKKRGRQPSGASVSRNIDKIIMRERESLERAREELKRLKSGKGKSTTNAWSDAAREAAKRKRQQRQRSKYKSHDLNDEALQREHVKQVTKKVEQKRYGGSYKKRLGAMTDEQLLQEKFDPRYSQGKTFHRATMVHREMKRRGATTGDF